MKSILFVEDDEITREVISVRLTRAGYGVIMAEDGYKALAAVATQAFDLVILDISMPGLSGLDIARRLRASSATAAWPLLALSASTAAADRKRALDAGCTDYDTKPVNLPRLLGKIEDLLARTPPPQASSRTG